MEKKKYSFTKGLKVSILRTVIPYIPVFVGAVVGLIPANLSEMTVGALLLYVGNVGYNFLKTKYS